MASKNTKEVAQRNEIRILRALARFGWLRTRDIAALVWTTWAKHPQLPSPTLRTLPPSQSGLRMAQRTLRRLKETKRVSAARAPDGSIIYALTEAGTRHLEDCGLRSLSNTDLIRSFSSSHFRHRCISNEIAISAIVEGFKVSTEREISTGEWAGGEKGVLGKKPDVLIQHLNSSFWVEVEKSRKNAREQEKLERWVSFPRNFVFLR